MSIAGIEVLAQSPFLENVNMMIIDLNNIFMSEMYCRSEYVISGDTGRRGVFLCYK